MKKQTRNIAINDMILIMVIQLDSSSARTHLAHNGGFAVSKLTIIVAVALDLEHVLARISGRLE